MHALVDYLFAHVIGVDDTATSFDDYVPVFQTRFSNLFAEADLEWPNGAVSLECLEAYSGLSSRPIYNSDEGIGLTEWSITAEPGGSPGVLQIATYLIGNTDLAAPDTLDRFDLSSSGWSTGALGIASYTTAGGIPIENSYIRWTPAKYAGFLP